jgi:glycosyltransferase involved in cell wall biosynthesis
VLTVIVHLSTALAKRGHQLEVWQLHEWSPDAYADQRTALESGDVAQLTVAPDTPLWRVGGPVSALASERAIDLVHLHGAFNRSNTAISRAIAHPYVFSPHSGYDPVSLRRSRIRKVVYRLLFELSMLRRAALVAALTDVELDQVRSFGATGAVVVIPNGVATPARNVDPLTFRRELGLPDDAHLAAFVGRLDVYRKGLDRAVRGLAEAPRWHLALVGPRFRDVPRLERMISELAIQDRVHFTGERHGKQLQEALAGADLFVLLSRWEGLPMALLEAMSYGTPAVVSPEVGRLLDVEHAGAGWTTRDGESLGALLIQFPDDGRPELESRERAARELAKRYEWDAVAERYEHAYKMVLRSRESMT